MTQMAAAEVDKFLDSERTLILVTLRPGGAPVAHPLWFVRLGNAVYINTRTDSFKYRNIRRDERVCCLVESGDNYFELRGVRIEGHCTLVDDPGELERVHSEQVEKDRRLGSGTDELPGWFAESRGRRLAKGSRVVLKISMDHVVSWDFSRAREHYRQ